MTLWIFSAKTSPRAPPKTVKSWLKMQTRRPSMVPKPGHDAVGVGTVVLEPHPVRPVAGQHVELLEGVLVEQVVDALAGGHLALGVVALDRLVAPGVEGFVLAFGQLGQPLGHGVFHRAEAIGPGRP